MTPARAVEVAALFEDSVIKVRHLTEPRPPAANERLTHILLVGGGLSLMGALGTFIASVHQISAARRAHDAAVAAHQASGPFVLSSGGQWLDFMVTLCLVAGTWAILHGLGRLIAARRSRDFVIGPSPNADVSVPLAEDRALVRANDSGWLIDGQTPITEQTREVFDFGALRIIVAGTDAPSRLPNALRINWLQEAYIGGVAMAAGVFLGLLYMIPPDPKTLALDTIHSDLVAHYVIKAPEPPEAPVLKKDGPVGGGGGAAHAGPAGTTGKKDAPRKDAAFKQKGTSPIARIGRAEMEKVVSRTGILGVLGESEQSHIGSIFTRDSALGSDAEESFGNMRATVSGDSWGTGLDLLGTGPGGGGHSTTTIGFGGDLRTIGPGGPGRRNGYPPTGSVALPGRRPTAPTFEPPTIKKGEGLTKEIIARVVHFHKQEIKFCYDKRLSVKNTLGSGRVVAAFIISGNGMVVGSSIASSTLGDTEVESCIAGAIKRWEFPKPSDSSMVSVTYPFVLHAPGN